MSARAGLGHSLPDYWQQRDRVYIQTVFGGQFLPPSISRRSRRKAKLKEQEQVPWSESFEDGGSLFGY